MTATYSEKAKMEPIPPMTVMAPTAKLTIRLQTGAQSQLIVAPDEVGRRGASTYKMSESSMAAVARRLVKRDTGYGCETKRGEGVRRKGSIMQTEMRRAVEGQAAVF